MGHACEGALGAGPPAGVGVAFAPADPAGVGMLNGHGEGFASGGVFVGGVGVGPCCGAGIAGPPVGPGQGDEAPDWPGLF